MTWEVTVLLEEEETRGGREETGEPVQDPRSHTKPWCFGHTKAVGPPGYDHLHCGKQPGQKGCLFT